MSLCERSREFIDYLESFEAGLPELALADLTAAVGGPERVAIIAVDLVRGFAKEGALASPRVDAILPAVVRTLRLAEAAGIHEVALVQDSHPPGAAEFGQFPEHCVAGSGEDHTVPELREFFAGSAMHPRVIEKNSLSAMWAPDFVAWQQERLESGVNGYIVLGDCTDLCVVNVAVPLKTQANQHNRPLRLVLPADCLATYDLPVAVAQGVGAMPHDGDLMQAVSLYYLALTGCDVVRRLV